LVPLLLVFVLVLTGCTGRSLIAWGSGWSATAASDGTVYVGTRQGEILALYANKNGRLKAEEQVKWRFSPEKDQRLGGVFSMPAVGEEHIYVGDRGDADGKNGKLYALRKDRSPGSNTLESGEWKKDIEGAIVGGAALAEAEGLVLVGSNDGYLYAFDTTGDTTSKMAWRFPTGGRIWATPVVWDGVVYFGSMDHYVYALTLEAGLNLSKRLLWKYKTGGAVVSTPLLLDGPKGPMVIIGSFDKKLYALKARTSNPGGEMVWPQPFEGDDWFWAGAVSDGKYIFAPSMAGTVYALDTGGASVWAERFEEKSPVVSTPVIVEGKVVVATDKGKLHLLRASDGEELEVSKELDSRVKAPLSHDGTMVFVGAEDKTVRGVDVEKWAEVWRLPAK